MAWILNVRHKLDKDSDNYKYTAVDVLGGQGIKYEYRLRYGADPDYYYRDAYGVWSIKGDNDRPSTSKKHFGKVYSPGTYQPVGDKRYFNYYQYNKMSPKQWFDFNYELIAKQLIKIAFKVLKMGNGK